MPPASRLASPWLLCLAVMVGIQPSGAAVTYAFLNFYTAESALAAAAACRGKVLPWLTGERGSWRAEACTPGHAPAGLFRIDRVPALGPPEIIMERTCCHTCRPQAAAR